MAPELLHPGKFGLSSCQASKQADIYAFGMVVYEVLTGRPPFRRTRHPEVVLLVMEGKRPWKPEIAGDIGFGGGTWELVEQCWDQERRERPTVEQVSEHFQRVARDSSIIPPGPTTSAYYEAEASTGLGSAGGLGNLSFSQYLLRPTHPGPNLTSYKIQSPIIHPIPKGQHPSASQAYRGSSE